jgi:uncharacterized damage-inducible protein DinB
MMHDTFELGEAVALLRNTPSAVRALLAQLPAAWLDTDEGAGTWSPREVVAHLTDLEDTDWLRRARIILEHGAALPFETVDREAFRERFAAMPLEDLLVEFERRRQRNLDALSVMALDDTALALPGLHPALGPVSMGQLLATWVVHDLTHIVQIARTMARRYDSAVGPWKAYLGVLTRGIPPV